MVWSLMLRAACAFFCYRCLVASSVTVSRPGVWMHYSDHDHDPDRGHDHDHDPDRDHDHDPDHDPDHDRDHDPDRDPDHERDPDHDRNPERIFCLADFI